MIISYLLSLLSSEGCSLLLRAGSWAGAMTLLCVEQGVLCGSVTESHDGKIDFILIAN